MIEEGPFSSSVEERAKKSLCDMGISSFTATIALSYIKNGCSKENGANNLARVLGFVLDKINHSREKQILQKLDMAKHVANDRSEQRDWQCGCPEIIRGLRGIPIWDHSNAPWYQLLESKFNSIKQEFLAARSHQSEQQELEQFNGRLFQPYRSPHLQAKRQLGQIAATEGLGDSATPASEPSSSASLPSTSLSSDNNCDEPSLPSSDSLGTMATSSGSWSVCYLSLHGLDFEANRNMFPATCDVISSLPRPYQHAFLSALISGSHITKHYGPTNKKLRCMLPLVVPRNDANSPGRCWLRVADQKVYLEEGKCILFDDSFEHEAGFDVDENGHTIEGDKDVVRVVLVADVWHPDLTDEEVKIMSYISKAQMTAARKLSEQTVQLASESSGDGQHASEAAEAALPDDFMNVILNARRQAMVPNELVWGYSVRDD